jgi:hypothetical protein
MPIACRRSLPLTSNFHYNSVEVCALKHSIQQLCRQIRVAGELEKNDFRGRWGVNPQISLYVKI